MGEQLIQKGFYLSFGVAFWKKEELKRLLEDNFDKIFFETDNRKESIIQVFEMASSVLSKSKEEIEKEQFIKVKRVFNVR